jgi:metal-dependent hydrolase (beta-lactamase superfamily II)
VCNQVINHKQLRYQVVTHHHQDHLGGLNEAIDLGATLVTVEDNVNAITDLGLDIRKITIAHGARVFTVNDMQASVDAYKPGGCLADRPVCM